MTSSFPRSIKVEFDDRKPGDEFLPEPGYVYCFIQKHYSTPKQEVWFSANQGQTIVGRSRTVAHHPTFAGGLIRFNREVEAARRDLLKALTADGWQILGGEHDCRRTTLRKPAPP
jgi:hypothetical protein